MSVSRRYRQTEHGEAGYPWLHFHIGTSWVLALLTSVLIIGLAAILYLSYGLTSEDAAADSLLGLFFAIAGTICLLVAVLLYSHYRHNRHRVLGQLNTALNWHIFLSITGMALLIMHSFGNFHAKTGTYALYGLIVLIVSGAIGRLLDRILPRLMADEQEKLLALSLSPQETRTLHAILHATQREQLYRYLLNYWRRFHSYLALLTIGLIIWHLIYVIQVFLSAAFH